ncbi:MAG: hypothetical protein ABIP77_09435 [Candidatus Limnocylindrales bacterium]
MLFAVSADDDRVLRVFWQSQTCHRDEILAVDRVEGAISILVTRGSETNCDLFAIDLGVDLTFRESIDSASVTARFNG